MTANEAIKSLNLYHDRCIPPLSPEFREAVGLGGEALQWVQQNRYSNYPHHIPLLRGETEGE